MSFSQFLSSWASSLGPCFSHSKDWCLQIDSYKLAASVTHRLEVGLTGWGGVLLVRHCQAHWPHNLMHHFVNRLLVIKSFASLDQMVLLGSVNSHRAPAALLALVGAPPLCRAQISSYYMSCPIQSLIVSQAPLGLSAVP